LLGTVFLYVDYSVPVDEVRNELTRILTANPDWDKKANVLQVTNTDNRSVELRALMSAADSSLLWNVRCDVREKLLQFLQHTHPGSLPQIRMNILDQEKLPPSKTTTGNL
jgi:small-conductance mechanosensitive channel